MSKHNMEEEVAKAKFQGLHIQEGDVLLILVSALDEIAVKPFNLNTANKVGSDGSRGINQYVEPSQYLVNEEGYISFPVLGNVYTKGMTQVQLKQELESRLKRYLTDPLVTITLKNFNVSVLGEVKEPGQKESVSQKINIFQALGLAGDMTDFGDRTNVKLIRTDDSGTDQIVNIDLTRSDVVSSPYYYMKQNDILYVQPDKNKQVQANSNPNRALTFQIIGALLTAGTLIIALTRK
ncbi:polysaccharide export outer membrane protein [Chryseobacterium bernardetii]|nr:MULTISPECIES: polysaccharide biosynthesis/export family protein [Chryseobacterium]MDR6370463.1 polysaccharide export outer membrane protein [Chryseobacterium vietnamense]MDR6441469.1 polysaccharide export outer membrane protein [Chryseobacterium bernardetii]MDR6456911.1 polysaccharide export outer membrane protein [Chryseobacterium vietnamense]MDR6485575.1 polysaccharide export outer membrane protein [Chryseobacterium vietnamense]